MGKSFLVALPVRNGGVHFRECVNSILGQTHREFELAVLDNASTDGSMEWLRSQSDPRISIYESQTSMSIEENWGRILQISTRHEFMTITGHDDVFDADFLATIVGLIETRPNARVYFAHFRLIDGSGQKIRSCIPMPQMESAHEFLRARMKLRRDSFGTGYVFRFADYVRVGGIPLYRKLLFADDVLWMMLMSTGHCATHAKECFSYRVHATSTSFAPDWRSMFAAFSSYLDFLAVQVEASTGCAQVVGCELGNFARYLFRWGYLSAAKTHSDRANAGQVIATLVPRVQMLLQSGVAERFQEQVRRDLFGAFSRPRWIAWRAQTWLSRQLASRT